MLVFTLAFLAALCAGLMGGFFYAFSGLVMPALGRRPAAEAIGAMQAINVVVLNPLFFVLFFGPAALGLALAVSAPFALPPGEALIALAASVIYAIGSIGVTIARNVPLNDTLAAITPEGSASAAVWRDYLRDWTFWNHVRAIACLVASAGFLLVA
ncbi:anthrone oxygenase family protein [Methylopila sp. M107]|uniref:anthrone oxygenase family protein n=1 Tax=Methylopila sp. M107 TaxID=1101190 RepID=UPI00058EA790|nr:anthrone oxygenase family protein [Methylopila sp. M107]